MTDINQNQDQLNLESQESVQLPSMLNVLTILTYIGCAIGAIGGIYNYFTICKSVEKLTSQDLPDMGGFIGKMMDSAIELSIKQCDNRLVIFVATMVTTLLCFFGAFMIRGLKKQGFIVYVLGELIGPASMMGILGGAAFSGMMLFSALFPVVMVILYATQRKYLVN